MQTLIKVINLEKIYQDGEVSTIALKNVSLKIHQGEFIAITGPSGSGKSTLLHILGLLDRPTNGEYYFDNKLVSRFSDEKLARLRNKKMGFVFQDFNLLSGINVFENVKLPLIYSGIKKNQQEEMVWSALEGAGIKHRAKYYPAQLSGGEKQRVAIARAIVNRPSIIFADEPTGNLDSKSGQVVMETIQTLNQQGHTIVLVTHETYTANYAERIIKLQDGKIEKEKEVTNRLLVSKDGFRK